MNRKAREYLLSKKWFSLMARDEQPVFNLAVEFKVLRKLGSASLRC